MAGITCHGIHGVIHGIQVCSFGMKRNCHAVTQPSWMIVDEAGNSMPLFLLVKSCWIHIVLVWILLYAGFFPAFAWKFGGLKSRPGVVEASSRLSVHWNHEKVEKVPPRCPTGFPIDGALVHGKSVHKMDDTPYNVGLPSDVCWFTNPINYSYKYHKP